MEEAIDVKEKKKTKHTIGISLEAFDVVNSLSGPGKKFNTTKAAASDLIISSNLAVNEANLAKGVAEKKVDWLQDAVDRLTDREKTLVQEGKSARDALGRLEDKQGLYKFLLYASWLIFGIGMTVNFFIF